MTDTNARLTKVESAVATMSAQFTEFLKETKDHRDRTDRDNQQLWQALKEQGHSMQISVDRLASKSEMSWSKIASVGGFLFVCGSGLAALVWQLGETRIHQLEIQSESNSKLRESQLRQLEIRDEETSDMLALRERYDDKIRALEKEVRETHDKFLLRICDETHEGLRRITEAKP